MAKSYDSVNTVEEKEGKKWAFMCLFAICIVSFGEKIPDHALCSILYWIVCPLSLSFLSSLKPGYQFSINCII